MRVCVETVMRQWCMMTLWLRDIYMDSCMREMKARVGYLGLRLVVRGEEQFLMASLFTDDTVFLAESR